MYFLVDSCLLVKPLPCESDIVCESGAFQGTQNKWNCWFQACRMLATDFFAWYWVDAVHGIHN